MNNFPLHTQVLPHDIKSSLPKRSEVDPGFQWNIGDLYATDAAWESDFARVDGLVDRVATFRGKLGESADKLYQCLQLRDALGQIFDSLYVYAHLQRDQDTGNPQSQALADRITILQTHVRQSEAYLVPEILGLPDGTIEKYFADHPDLRMYKQYIDDIWRVMSHTLSPSEERLLAMTANMAAGPRNIFNMLNNADIKFPSIKDEEGNSVEVTKGRYSQFMESTDRRVRHDAYHALLGTYQNYANTLAATLSANVSRDIFYSRARKYDSCLHSALNSYNIPIEVFDTVVRVVGENLEPLHRYTALRRRILKLEKLEPYDLFVPLFSKVDEKIPYEKSVRTVLDGLAPMGKEYVELLEKGFRSGWVDVVENAGKRSGAYSWGAYGTHPFVLLNYQGRLDDVFTIAHEMGHSLHTYYTTSEQPYVYADYSIFTAEVASTTNEAILMDYYLKNTDDRDKKLYLLNHYLDQIRSTVYTQVLFAEFEREIHETVENGDPLTADFMGKTFRRLYRKYNGVEVEDGPAIGIYWARIPHFYNSFYVYQYATGYSAATMLSQKILAGEKGALDRYIRFLKGGSSKYPIDLLNAAGVDMVTPDPVQETVGLFGRLLDEVESLLDEGGG